MRTPARDAMIAHASGELGSGWVFGVREALDAAGAMLGPLIVAVVLALRGSFQDAFAILAIPVLLTFVVLAVSVRLYPNRTTWRSVRHCRSPTASRASSGSTWQAWG